MIFGPYGGQGCPISLAAAVEREQAKIEAWARFEFHMLADDCIRALEAFERGAEPLAQRHGPKSEAASPGRLAASAVSYGAEALAKSDCLIARHGPPVEQPRAEPRCAECARPLAECEANPCAVRRGGREERRG